ncbi:hypothetical protein IEN85_18285 [Pelagicoccus sp. NFK12]|uniref:Glycosyltransferase n=2 Tax=Pelagicoccus enzymogenes TaxID=2773457 RepID=A0A927IJE6_9BACT|nr:hypothetical protein [Pelagicoccus enzymogenes]
MLFFYVNGMNRRNKVLVVTPTLGDTKDSRRIDLIKSAGFSVQAAAFDRGSAQARPASCEVITLARISDGNYLARLFRFAGAIAKLRKLCKSASIVHSMSPDLTGLCHLACIGLQPKLVSDVADIREIQISHTPTSALLRSIEAYISIKSDLLIVTSKGFIDWYFNEKLKIKPKNFLVIENKLDESSPPHRASTTSKKIRIGYFGCLRSNWTIKLLLELLKSYPDKFEIHTAGVDMLDEYDLIETSKRVKGFNYLGPYKSPEDLPQMYSRIDLSAIFYPDNNDKIDSFVAKAICRSNRFYEACKFQIPIISFSFCGDGLEVENLKNGLTIDTFNIKEAAKSIKEQLTEHNLKYWKQRSREIPREVYLLVKEAHNLKLRYQALLKSKPII